jgi:hypothetical protein
MNTVTSIRACSRHGSQETVGKSISNAQVAADVPHEKVLSLVKTATTCWGNQDSQVSTNCTLRGAIDPTVDKFKRENCNNKEAIVEENESDQGSKAGRPVSAADLGITTKEWEDETNEFDDKEFKEEHEKIHRNAEEYTTPIIKALNELPVYYRYYI